MFIKPISNSTLELVLFYTLNNLTFHLLQSYHKNYCLEFHRVQAVFTCYGVFVLYFSVFSDPLDLYHSTVTAVKVQTSDVY